MSMTPTERFELDLYRRGIPERMHGGLIRFIMKGTKPGDFLCAVLENNLKMAVQRADDENAQLLVQYVQFLVNRAPMRCWGSVEARQNWKGVEPDKDPAF